MTEAMEISLTTQALKSSQGSLLQLAAGHSAFPDVTSFLVVLHSLTPFVGIPTALVTYQGAMEAVVDTGGALVVDMEAATVVTVVAAVAAVV